MSAIISPDAPPVARARRKLRRGRSGRGRSPLAMLLRYVIVGLALAFFLFPIVWIAGILLKLPADYLTAPPIQLPQEITFRH